MGNGLLHQTEIKKTIKNTRKHWVNYV